MVTHSPLLQHLVVLIRCESPIQEVIERLASKIPMLTSFGGILKDEDATETQLFTKYLVEYFPKISSIDVKEQRNLFAVRSYRDKNTETSLNATTQCMLVGHSCAVCCV